MIELFTSNNPAINGKQPENINRAGIITTFLNNVYDFTPDEIKALQKKLHNTALPEKYIKKVELIENWLLKSASNCYFLNIVGLKICDNWDKKEGYINPYQTDLLQLYCNTPSHIPSGPLTDLDELRNELEKWN